jgi:hypothetical protein
MNGQANGAPNGAFMDRNPNQPTPDQLYLAERLGESLTPAAIVKLNKAHGRLNVSDAMRQLRGFPPAEPVENVYAYLATVAALIGQTPPGNP